MTDEEKKNLLRTIEDLTEAVSQLTKSVRMLKEIDEMQNARMDRIEGDMRRLA